MFRLPAGRWYSLLAHFCSGIDQITTIDAPPVATDYFAPLLHIPAVFGHSPNDFPHDILYITAEAALASQWRDRLAQIFGPQKSVIA